MKSLLLTTVILVGCVSNDQVMPMSARPVEKAGADELNKMIAEVDTVILSDAKTFEEEELAAEATVEDDEASDSESSVKSPAQSVESRIGSLPDMPIPEPGKIPMELNAKVEEWITYFTGRDRERFQRFLNRGEKYKSTVVEILRDYGVPTELYYLAMIESGYVTNAKSHASAVGIWQFIAGTGKRYGLERNSYVDERIDPIRATMAAATYLRDLNRVFQNWYLAMAAYNAGEGRILQSIMRADTRDFWELVKKRALPRETMDYVPKFLAAAIIGHNPAKFGFTIEKEGNLPDLVQVAVPTPVHLNSVASAIDLSPEELKAYNPHLRQAITPPGKNEYEIWVPRTHSEAALQAQTVLAANKIRNARRVVDESPAAVVSKGFHTVRRGETLASIARKYGTKRSILRQMNGLRSNRVRPGSKLRIQNTETRQEVASVQKYRVKRGDNLAKIATRFGVTIQSLKKANRISRSQGLRVGQVLKIASVGKASNSLPPG